MRLSLPLSKSWSKEAFPYEEVMTWSTDGFTERRLKRLPIVREEGCAVVEMECGSCGSGSATWVVWGELLFTADSWQIWTTTTVASGVLKLLIRHSNSVLLLCTTCECSYYFMVQCKLCYSNLFEKNQHDTGTLVLSARRIFLSFALVIFLGSLL